MSTATLPQKEIRWSASLIKRLRGSRTNADLAALLDVTVKEIELWQTGALEPSVEQAKKLAALAAREHFLRGWKLAGSGVLLGNLDDAFDNQSHELRQQLDQRANRLWE